MRKIKGQVSKTRLSRTFGGVISAVVQTSGRVLHHLHKIQAEEPRHLLHSFAGGDIVLGAATVILAMGQDRIAAAINDYLAKKGTVSGPNSPKASSAT